jgi:PKD repeat protein
MPDGKTSRNRVLDYLIPRGTQTAEIKLTVSGERFLKVEKEIELKAEPMAAAEFTFSGVLYAGAATDYVLFDASRSNSPEDKPLTYKWSFGDGSAGSGKMVRHHYKKPGKYRVRLTINDSSRRCRAVSIEKIIEIKKRVR